MRSNRHWSLAVALGIAVVTSPAAVQEARAPRPTQQKIDSLRRRLKDRIALRGSSDAVLSAKLREALSVNGVGFGRRKNTVLLGLENWTQTDLSTAALAPIARKALRILFSDTSFHSADTLSVRFSDYAPHVVTLSWTAADFRIRPERFRVHRDDRSGRH